MATSLYSKSGSDGSHHQQRLRSIWPLTTFASLPKTLWWITIFLVFQLIFICNNCNLANANKIDANMTIAYSWTDEKTSKLFASLNIVRQFNWAHDINEDIVFEDSLTLEEAYRGI